MNTVPRPKFTWSLITPKYWPVWFGFGLLALIVNILPFRLIQLLGALLGRLVKVVGKKRCKIAKRNLELSFPEMSQQERDDIFEKNMTNTGMALLETGMAWFWPKWRLKALSNIVNKEALLEQVVNNRGVLVVCSHHLNLELTAMFFSQFTKGYGVYRAHTNPAYEFIQHRGRTRSGHKMVDRKDVKAMLKLLRQGHRLWYLPDHDYGRRSAVYVPFFGVEHACTTTGSSMLIDASKCAVISGVSVRKDNQYTLYVGDDISDQVERRNPEQAARVINGELERMIRRDISAWMWLHRRFKNQPDEHAPSLYK
ncbi:LpxL/LpxP family Kdo(2)-lipid IV(A) lauroyl/palmitoleoyl acyltransferase [Vibrio sp. LaRot3]|uniref:LpxL/LpxP family Kdo(2)-lipid IV(A) lauroyl/palmitoleoyl acyltransferase n=1 Tax=Vibrio sp. LaRot3 TaxID=2998829 RepID=UPI0022CE1F5D|nr:LpxL/LpxP family Kdo(2)-lipid IV(A) lauroyl/palmitoleoyl acyltransferase [Vibrio sp. LaRot3]MDA0148640.1 LpxL/LpxP family Kdo(2)-lipid IV(A) lauroyl/palmitoleoyl acyltransferase [Vibrio sp. LaRot3]